MAQVTKICFIAPSSSTFSRSDLEFLKRNYAVRDLVVDDTGSRQGLKRDLRVLFAIFMGALWADLTYSWFAHNHAYLAVIVSKILKKRSIVVIGGYEVAREPEIGYGALLDPTLSRRVRYIIRNADCLLAVSDFTRHETQQLNHSRNVTVVYNGIDTDLFSPGAEKEDLVVTVCLLNRANITVKGLDTFIAAARLLPQVRFAVIGRVLDDSIEGLKQTAPSNVEFVESPSQEDLIGWYRRAKVYCQLSYRESFGVALAEAMSCECIPVVTDRGALPEVVGDVGFVVPYGDAEVTAEAIADALQSDVGTAARKRIDTIFSIDKREKNLRKMIEGIPP
jgi:glycosyltransferase involved in cell wall biosynthesis